jgi:hypothetical protein
MVAVRPCVLGDAPPVLAWGRLFGRSSELVKEFVRRSSIRVKKSGSIVSSHELFTGW